MQPIFRQVPPSSLSFSIIAVFNPSCPARIAATYPPGPEPMMTTSNFSMRLEIERQLLWIFDALLHFHQKRDRLFAIDRAVIVTKGEIHHRPDFDLAVNRHRPRHDLMHAEDSALRWIQNR